MPKPLSGAHVALLSGFADDGAFDPGRQRAIARHALGQDVAGLYVAGSSAEAALMAPDEIAHQLEVVLAEAQGSGKVMTAHVGQPALRDSVRLAQHAEKLGYDAISALPPYAFLYAPEEVHAYYRAISEATALPLIIYEVPVRTGRTTPLAELERLFALPTVAGIKYTAHDLFALGRIRRSFPDKTVFFGFDEMLGGAAALGVDGGIGTTYNVLGGLYKAILAAADASDVPRLRELQAISQGYVALILDMGVIPGVKATLEVLGVDAGPARAPLALRSDPAAARRSIEAFCARSDVKPWLDGKASTTAASSAAC